MNENMKPEAYFLIYAFPAISACSKNISAEEISRLENMAIKGESPDLAKLKQIFPNAFLRIKNYIGKDNGFTIEDYRDYWWKEHNRIIENKEQGYEKATDEESEICMVSFPIVSGFDEDLVVIRYEDGKEKKALNYRKLNLSVGKRVSSHKGRICEVISEDFYKNYFQNAS